jgi:hypothetical protein
MPHEGVGEGGVSKDLEAPLVISLQVQSFGGVGLASRPSSALLPAQGVLAALGQK